MPMDSIDDASELPVRIGVVEAEGVDMDMDVPKKPHEYTGPDRYIEWFEDYTPYTLTDEQRAVLRAVANNRYTLVYGANSIGKTWASIAVGYSFRNVEPLPNSTMVTSGTFGKLKRTFSDDFEDLHTKVQEQWGVPPGEWKESPYQRLEVDGHKTWQFSVISPERDKEIEGFHNDYTLGIIEEADGQDVTAETIDAVESLVSDENDRVLVVANPPTDESNSVSQVIDSDKYHTLQFSTFDSHNVQVETGERDGERIGGIASLVKLKDDWKDYNGLEWPGIDTARQWSAPYVNPEGDPIFKAHEYSEGDLRENPDFRADLDTRWYRRRAGIIPPAGASEHRPIYVEDVREAFDRSSANGREADTVDRGDAVAVGVDVARKGGDETVVATIYPHTARFLAWSHTDHPENERRSREYIDSLVDAGARPAVAVDAQGEGSGVADTLRDIYGAVRFKNSERAVDTVEWDNKWTESLHHLGDVLDGLALGTPAIAGDPTLLREDLFTAARHVAYENRALKTGDVYRATPKTEIKAEIGRSPDRLDAFAMAAWVSNVDVTVRRETRRRRPGDRGRRRIES